MSVIFDATAFSHLLETEILAQLNSGKNIRQILGVTPQVVHSQTFTSWDEMKKAYRGNITNFAVTSQRQGGHKPLGSPNVRTWLDNGGTLRIDKLHDGTHVWYYTKDGVTVPFVPKMRSSAKCCSVPRRI